jgi:hypothetical protein
VQLIPAYIFDYESLATAFASALHPPLQGVTGLLLLLTMELGWRL